MFKPIHVNQFRGPSRPILPPENENLAVDMDDLQDDPLTCDEMFDVLMKDPEWSRVFKPTHVNQFRGPSGPTLPLDFDLSSNPVNYFQLFFY